MSKYISYTLAPGDKLLVCPYEKAHRILEPRFSQHLMKCRKNYEKQCLKLGVKPKYKICDACYNHHVHEREWEYHTSICPGQMWSDQFSQVVSGGAENTMSSGTSSVNNFASSKTSKRNNSEKNVSPILADDDEIWDDDVPHHFHRDFKYRNDPDATSKLFDKNLIVVTKGLTKSEKKQHRENLTDRFFQKHGHELRKMESELKEPSKRIPVGQPGWNSKPVPTTSYDPADEYPDGFDQV